MSVSVSASVPEAPAAKVAGAADEAKGGVAKVAGAAEETKKEAKAARETKKEAKDGAALLAKVSASLHVGIKTLDQALGVDKVTELCKVLVNFGVSADLTVDVLKELRFNDMGVPTPASFEAALNILKMQAQPEAYEQTETYLRMHLLDELLCDSDTMCKLQLTNLREQGLDLGIFKACMAMLDTKEGDVLPEAEVHPADTLEKWAFEHPKHGTFAMSCVDYLRGIDIV